MRKFLVIVDDTPESEAALRYAARRARSTGGRVALLRLLPTSAFDYFTGVREELEAELRREAEAALNAVAGEAEARSGAKPELLIKVGDARSAIRAVLGDDEDIKVLVLATAVGGRGPGPIVSSLVKDGGFGPRKIPVTLVPGDLTEAEIEALA